MSGLIDKITHRHGHKNVATTTGTTAPIISAPQAAGGPILTSQTSTLNTSGGYVQQPGLTKTNVLNTSGGVMNTSSSGTILNSANTLNTTTPLTTSTSSTTIQQPIQHATTHVSAPIIQETVRNDRVVEVQPILHREVDQNIVHHIEKHYHEPAPVQGGIVERQALVQQQVHTNVVNEIQPIIHRERVVPVVERSEQHLTQHIVQPTIHTHEVVYERGTYQQQGLGIQQQGLGIQQQGFQQQNLYSGLNFPYTGATNSAYGYPTFSRDQKALRFEQKAAEWERRGNMAKAQKNRNKALQYRQMGQPGYVRPQRPQNYYTDRANLFNQKALRYQQLGMNPQAQRYQGRAQRLRTKHGLAPWQGQTLGLQQQGLPIQQGLGQNLGLQQQGFPIQQGLGQNLGFQQQGLGQNLGLQQGLPQQGLGQNLGLQQGGLSRGLNSYQGLNFPYTGATNHPTYGYPKLNRDQKAARFEQKAAEWERRGDMTRAQKNRNKALQYRQMGQPGYVRPQRPQNYYSDRANLFNQKAQNFQQLGMQPQAQRYQGRADRLRSKHNLGPYQQNNLMGQNNLGQQQGQNLSWTLQGLPQDKLQQQQNLNNQQFSAAR